MRGGKKGKLLVFSNNNVSSLSQIELMVLITLSSVYDRTLDEDGTICCKLQERLEYLLLDGIIFF